MSLNEQDLYERPLDFERLEPIQLLLTGIPDSEFEEANQYGGSDGAPWTSVPLKQARDFINADDTRALNILFPAVHQEDRTAKIKDIITAQGVDYLSHARSARMVAQEFEVENYEYDTEMETIKVERTTLPPPEASLLPGEPGGGGSVPAATAADAFLDDVPEQQPRRAEISGEFQHDFRKQQREAFETVVLALHKVNESLRVTMDWLKDNPQTRQLRESVDTLGTRIDQLQPVVNVHPAAAPDVHVAGAEVHVEPAAVTVTVPERGVTVEAAQPAAAAPQRAVVKDIERDKHGLITRITERPVEPKA